MDLGIHFSFMLKEGLVLIGNRGIKGPRVGLGKVRVFQAEKET